MPPTVTVDILDRMRPSLASLVGERAKRLRGLQYCDLRIQVKEEKGAVAENGSEKTSGEDYSFDFGVRVIAGGRLSASGYYGRILGAADASNIAEVVWEGIQQAHQRATASARLKNLSRGRFGSLGDSLASADLAPVTIIQDAVPAVYTVDPRGVPLRDTVAMAVDGCKAAQGQSDRIVYAAASTSTFLLREMFFSSDGADIDQSSRLTKVVARQLARREVRAWCVPPAPRT
jgi:predicted Zn-dependent protease